MMYMSTPGQFQTGPLDLSDKELVVRLIAGGGAMFCSLDFFIEKNAGLLLEIPKTWSCGTPSKWPFHGL